MQRMNIKCVGTLFIVTLGFLTTIHRREAFPAQTKPPVVYVAPIEAISALGLAPFLQRAQDEATQEGAAAAILDIITFGGRVDAAVQIRDALLNARVKTLAFVNKRAISAGAFITFILIASAKLAGLVAERLGQPAVMGELIAGILPGNLGFLGRHGLEYLRPTRGSKY